MPLTCTRFAVESCGSTHFPVTFESLPVEANFSNVAGTERAEVVVSNRAGASVGGGTILMPLPAAEWRTTTGVRLIAAGPGPYSVRLVVNGTTLAEATLHVRQAPTLPGGTG
jgi:hypothetical protein